MMTKFIANAALLVAGLVNQVALLYYGFGLWPISWAAVVICFCITCTLLTLRAIVERDEK